MAGTVGNPRIAVSLLPAGVVNAFETRKTILYGVMSVNGATTPGTATSGTLYQNVQNMGLNDILALFGPNSPVSYAILRWMQGNESNSRLDVIPFEDPSGGSAGTSTIALTGTATEAGEFVVSAVDERDFTATVAVPSGTTAAQAAALIDTAIDNLGSNILFSASTATATVTLTALVNGTVCNDWGVKVTGEVPGLTVALTGWSGGTGAVVTTTALDPISGLRYTTLLWPEDWQAGLQDIVDEFETRFNISNAIQDGAIYCANADTLANQITLLDGWNSQVLTFLMQPTIDEDEQKGPAVLQPTDFVAAFFVGAKERRLTANAPVSNVITTTAGVNDAFGGPHMASLPYFNTPLNRAPLTAPTYMYSPAEQVQLETAGGTVFGPNPAVTRMVMGPVVTTWVTDAGGNPDVSFHYANYVDTGSACREIFFNNLRSLFSQSRLTTGDLVAGYSITNEPDIKAKLLRIYRSLADIVLTRAGAAEESYFTLNTAVTVNLASRGVTITGPLQIVTQVGEITYTLQLNFDSGVTPTAA